MPFFFLIISQYVEHYKVKGIYSFTEDQTKSSKKEVNIPSILRFSRLSRFQIPHDRSQPKLTHPALQASSAPVFGLAIS